MMYLQSINIGTRQTMQIGPKSSETGIYKTPATGPVEVTVEGLHGDVIYSKSVHGGPDQALYVYGGADYGWWANHLGRELAPGTFGENLTITDLASATFRIGDRLRIGTVLLEVTSPRFPCPKLAKRMDDRTFIKQFRNARRPGFYCRVLETGSLRVGEPVSLEPGPTEHVTIAETFEALFSSPPDEVTIARILAAPIAINFRNVFETKLRDDSIVQAKHQSIEARAAMI
jgi:MOSC domain-containing protein YiiM